jgi:alkaline phosphatase D
MFGAAGAAALAACRRGAQVQSRRPRVTHGVQSGDVQLAGDAASAVVWARSDEPARMVVEWSRSPAFTGATRVGGPVVTPETDGTGVVPLAALPAGSEVHYRVRFEREAARGESAWSVGRFATPAGGAGAPFRMAWTGDTCGQGYGRSPDFGLRGYAAVHAAAPAFLLNSGDLVYADNPIAAETRIPGPGKRVWKNITNERVARVAESLADFRARFAYNLEDEHLAALAAAVPVVAQWDDHETHNNWYPGQRLDDDRYTERDASTLAARARRATFEWTPIGRGADPGGADATIHRVIHYGPLLDVIVVDLRTFRGANDDGVADSPMLGAPQARWLVEALAASTARWKIVACDQPLALAIEDGEGTQRWEAFADGAPAATGRERELAGVLADLALRRVENVVWLTADVHYAAAHHFDPARAALPGAGFSPFWEFVAGPIHAGTFGPNALDPTFGPEVVFQWAPPPGTGNLPPSDGLQSFGTIDVRADALTVTLWGIDGKARYEVDLPAR